MSLEKLLLITQPEAGRVPLVCLPGTYCSPEMFEWVDKTAFAHLQILPVSWMMSDGPWDISTLGLRVVQLIHELSLGPALLVGHSTGGAIVLAAAASEPEVVRGLLLVDTGAHMRGHGDVLPILKMIETESHANVLDALFRRSFSSPPSPEVLVRLRSYPGTLKREAALQALRSQAALDLTEKLATITAPVVVLHGRHDQARPLHFARELVEQFPHAELYLADCGHTPMVEAPHTYEQALRRLCELTEV
jgi:pimeloyl-ACP methyl ester carboxylesterase